MKYVLIVSLLFLGCTGIKAHVRYENTHQMFLQKAIGELDIGTKLITELPNGATLSIQSMEFYPTPDKSLLNMIEDHIAKDCLSSQIRVLDRDPDIVKSMIQEGASFQLFTDTLKEKKFYPTHLRPADYILSYRILECGLYTTPMTNNSIYREALVRLHIRLIDAKTGKIQFIKNVASLISDEISFHLNEYFENFHYHFIDNPYPLKRKKGGK